MDAEMKARWVAALRSGKYQRGAHGLRHSASRSEFPKHDSEFCCLGVLADLIDPSGWKYVDGFFTHSLASKQGGMALLKISVLSKEIQLDLAARNDCGMSFAEIADYIESEKDI